MATTTSSGYVDPTYGAAPYDPTKAVNAYSLTPTGWQEMPATTSPVAGMGADAVINGVKNMTGGQFVDYNGQQVLVGGNTKDGLTSGVSAYNNALAAQGKPGISAFEYDKMTNPTSYGARWGNDGTALQYDASGNLVSGTQGTALPHTTGTGVIGSAMGNGVAGSNGNWTSTASGAAMLPNPKTWDITADQTVEGRLANLVDPNNPLNAQITGQVNDAWAGRGLVNSGMAAGAAQDAIIKNAMQIAQPDAATTAKAAGYNADEFNQFSTKNSDYENQFRLNKQQQDSQYRIAQLNAETQKTIAGMNIDAQAAANGIATANKTLLETNGQAATAFNTAASAISAIQNNNQMDATTKTTAIANVWHDLQTQLKVLGATSGLNLTSQLDFSNYPGFDANGGWVGVAAAPAPAATPAPAAAPAPNPGSDGP